MTIKFKQFLWSYLEPITLTLKICQAHFHFELTSTLIEERSEKFKDSINILIKNGHELCVFDI